MPEIGVPFTDDRISMLYWMPRIEHLADTINIPETHFFKLHDAQTPLEHIQENPNTQHEETADTDSPDFGDLIDNIPAETIAQTVSELPTDHAHIRGDYKASRLAGGEGREINTNPAFITEQILHLLDSMLMMSLPLHALTVREYINVADYGQSYQSTICPEVRFIADEGEVLGGFLDVYPDDFDNSFTTTEQEETLTELQNNFENDYDQLHEWASMVASELDDAGWSIDFIQDEDGNWHLTDMALYGLYWDDDEECWKNLSHIPDDKPYNLKTHQPENLPKEPTDEMVRVSRKNS